MKDFTERFKRAVEGLSDEEVARVIDTSIPNVRRYRSGTVIPPAASLILRLLEGSPSR